MKRRLAAILVLTILLFARTGSASAQSALAAISIGSDSGNLGDTVIVPISLASQGGAQVSGVSLKLNFDGSQLAVSRIDPGSAANFADKDVGWSPTPTCTGTCTVIIFKATNNTVIPDGSIADVYFDVLPGASTGPVSLTLIQVAAAHPTDPNGVPVSITSGTFTVVGPTSTPPPTSTNTPAPTSTPTSTPGPSATPSITPTASKTPTVGPSPTASRTPTPSKTSPPTATHTPGPSPTPGGTVTPGTTATPQATPTQTATRSEAGEGLEIIGAAAATGTALAEFEGAVAATSTALAEEVAARPTDQIVETGPSSGVLQRPEVLIAAGLLLLAIVLGGGAAYLIWRRQQA